MKRIVGISCLSHDAAIAVISDDEILYAAHAERFSRKKMDKYLGGALLEDAARYVNGHFRIGYYERPFIKRTRELFAGQYRKLFSTPNVHDYLNAFDLFKGVKVNYANHHYAHACGGYFTSTFRDASIVVIDGIGEWDTLTIWQAEDRNIKRVYTVRYPHSLGLFYSAFTERCGFKANEEEYIMMGLSAFGEPKYSDVIRNDLIANSLPGKLRFKRNLHRGIRDWRPELNDYENIAASCQAVTEDLLFNIFQWVRENLPSRNLVYSGGVALNCVFNGRLAQQHFFDDIWIMPEPGDAGSSIGAALAQRGEWVTWRGAYLGHDLNRKLNVDGALKALLSGSVIGVAHGRAEFGPRSLGNRSLLADPRGLDVKDKVNTVKQRELFRPFAPIVLEEYAHEYFDLPLKSSPYMQFVARCRRPELIPAVCHVDGTSRVQTLNKNQNPDMYELLRKFHHATGCPILLNTSLNIKGEPLVNSLDDVRKFQALHGVEIF